MSGATYSSKGIISAVKNALTGEKDSGTTGSSQEGTSLRLYRQPEHHRPHLRGSGAGRHHLHAGASVQGGHHTQGLSLAEFRKTSR